MAGRVALPRPMALGTLGVRVMLERMVVRGRDDEAGRGEAEEVAGLEGLVKGSVEDTGGRAEEAGVEMGELRLDEEGEDLPVPLAWFWATDWVWSRLMLSA